MKIVLILSPSWGIETPHLGIALLAAGLRRHGFEVEVCDLNIQVHDKYKEEGLWKSEEDVYWEDENSIAYFIEENNTFLDLFVDKILSTNARAIGFSIYNTTIKLSLELAKRIKEKTRNKFIIFGGQQCFTKESAEWLIKDEAVDAIVIGEGDEILPELIRKIEKLKRIDFCPGLIYKENGEIIDCGMRPPVSNLDHLPFPDFSDFSLQSYTNPQQLSILSSRGCPCQCVFCSTKLFWIKYRSMSGDRIFQEVLYQLDRYKNVNFFTFNDHTVNANMKAFSRFIDLVVALKTEKSGMKNNYTEFSWKGAAIIREEMDNEFIKKMKLSGCVEIEFGIESASDKIRRLMRKPPDDINLVERVIRDTAKAGIGVRVNFMFGFPGETEGDFDETISFLKRNKDFFSQVHPSETFCCIDPGTYLFDHPDEFGVTNHRHSLFWESNDGKNIYPERLKRHQIFCEVANSLGIPLSPGGHKIMLHKEHFLKDYHRYKTPRIQ